MIIRGGNGAGAEQIARAKVATIRGVVRHHLRGGPVHVGRRSATEAMGRLPGRAHLRGDEPGFEFDGIGTGLLIGCEPQIGKWSGIFRRPRRLSDAERLQGFSGDDPRRDGGGKAFAQKWPKRLVLPSLKVARRPVIEQ